MTRRAFGAGTAIVALIGVGALVTGVSATRQEAAGDEMATELVDRWIGAIGGLQVYWPMRSVRYTLTTEMYEPETGRLRRARPRYVTISKTDQADRTRIERWEGDDFIVQSWDGSEVWATLNGELLAEGHRDYDQVRYVSGDVNYWIGLPYKLRDPGVNLHYRGVDDEGRHVVGVTFGEGIGLHDGDTWQYWFEDGKTWPVQVAYREEGRENFNRLRFEDIRSVDGYVFVGRRVHINAAGNVWKVLRTHDLELNPDVGSGTFARP